MRRRRVTTLTIPRRRAGQGAGAPLHCPPRTHPATSPVRRRTPLHMKAVAWDGAGGEAAALSYSVCGTPAPTVPPVLLDGRATPLVDHGSGVASAHLRGPFRGDQGGAALGQCPDGVWQFTPYFKKGVDKARYTHTKIINCWHIQRNSAEKSTTPVCRLIKCRIMRGRTACHAAPSELSQLDTCTGCTTSDGSSEIIEHGTSSLRILS